MACAAAVVPVLTPVEPAITTITNAAVTNAIVRLPETHTGKNCFCIRNMII
jgi:hypothetical protein